MTDNDTVSQDLTYGLADTPALKTAFLTAWEAAFARQLPSAVYDWIFNDRNDLYIVRAGDDVAAGYGLLRVPVVLNGERTDGAVCNNVFVTPAFQAKNLFVRIGRFALENAEKRGMRIALGIPNANAVAGHKRVGWTFFDPIHFLAIDRAGLPAAADVAAERIDGGNFDRWSADLEALSTRLSAKRGFSVVKTVAQFRWRYLERPATTYSIFGVRSGGRLRGYAVFKFYQPSGMLHIVDLEVEDDAALTSLLSAAGRLADPFRAVNIWGSTAHRERLLRAGFQETPDTNNLIFIHPYRKDAVAFNGEMNLVLGDNDVY